MSSGGITLTRSSYYQGGVIHSSGSGTLTPITGDTYYCDSDDVQRYLKRQVISSTTKVTLTDVDTFICQVYDIINARLNKVGIKNIPVPTSSTVSRRILKEINAIGAASKVELVAVFGQTGKKSDYGVFLEEEFERKMFMIENDPFILYDTGQIENRLKNSTESYLEEDSSKQAFNPAATDEFIQTHRIGQDSDGDYQVDGSITWRVGG